MPLTRTTHWATRELHDFILERKSMPFAWGTNDCCFFAADAVQAMTGTDIAADFRGKYTDQASAFELIKTITGGTSVADAAAYCAKQHGLIEWPSPKYAQRGDLVVIQDADQLIAGIVHLNGIHLLSVGQNGMKVFPHSAAVRAWHV